MNNVTRAEKLLEGFNNADWDLIREHAGDKLQYKEMATGRETHGVDAWIETSKGWRSAFSNATGVVQSRIEAGDQVIEEVVWQGTHDGDMLTPDGQTIPATHKNIAVPAVIVNTFEDGKLVAANNYFDMMTMMGQLGLIKN